MDLRKLKTLIDLVSESNIAELEITENEGKVRIVKSGAAQTMPYSVMTSGPASQPAAPQAPTLAAAPAADLPAAAVVPAAPSGFVVKSPMVGTYYGSSTPGGKAFVEVGSTVKVGQALCIIEAMKIMNEIESEQAGTVTQVLVENGQAVEFGQPMFVIE